MAQDGQRPRVVVTGLGAITGQGASVDDLWEGSVAGRVAIREVEHWPMEGYRTRLGGEVKDRVLPQNDYRRPTRFRDPVYDFAFKAAEEALENCGVHRSQQIPAERWGVVVASCNSGMLSAERWYREHVLEGQPSDPRLILLGPPQALAEALSGAFGMTGPVLTINTACAASANAIGLGAEMIRQGRADAVLAGGSEAISGVLFSGFNALESLSPKPAAPYSRDREGLSLGEGSGMMVLMRDDVAERLGAPVLAELRGYSLSADGYHPTAPHPEGLGAGRAIRAALKAAGIEASEIGYVNSHGTGTAKNDPAETAATKVGLGDHAYKTAVSSTKSMIGHLLGAAGAVENIITVKALEQQVAPPTANFTEPDPDCDLDYVPNQRRELKLDAAVSNNFAFGGANASVVWARAGANAEPPPVPAFDRIVVTGMAALTPAGNDVDALWEAYEKERVASQDEDGVQIARVDFNPADYLSPKERKRVDRIGLFSVITSKLALADAGLEVTDDNRARVGVIIGTGIGPMQSMEEFCRPIFEEGPGAANPAVFPNTVYNAAGGQVAMQVGAIGVASTITVGHAAGASAIAYAYDLARDDQADAMLAIGADTLTDAVVKAYKALGVVASGEPGPAARGFALAEAGVTLVLERLGKAQERGARIYGEVLGYAVTSDGKGVGRWDTKGAGIERAMRLALERTGVRPEDVGTIWAATSGLRVADRAERRAIQRLFGDGADVRMPKLKLGEPIGAGGSQSAALALRSWQDGDGRPALVNSLSLGGTNVSLVLAPFRD